MIVVNADSCCALLHGVFNGHAFGGQVGCVREQVRNDLLCVHALFKRTKPGRAGDGLANGCAFKCTGCHFVTGGESLQVCAKGTEFERRFCAGCVLRAKGTNFTFAVVDSRRERRNGFGDLGTDFFNVHGLGPHWFLVWLFADFGNCRGVVCGEFDY